ncbi:hypothetical protein [Kitasatospora sp. NPDC058190]|uniref:hypothetical protein n=1 Tax=Kitasatospora sp. NPDC058190 TaxID=3346371 RepID=UPI0036D8B740
MHPGLAPELAGASATRLGHGKDDTMLLLGLLLLGATGAFIGLLITDNTSGGPDYALTVLGNHIATLDSLAIFLAGIALTLIVGLGFAMVVAGARHRRTTGARHRRTAVRTVRVPPEEVAAEQGDRADNVAEVPPATTAKPARRHHFRFGH